MTNSARTWPSVSPGLHTAPGAGTSPGKAETIIPYTPSLCGGGGSFAPANETEGGFGPRLFPSHWLITAFALVLLLWTSATFAATPKFPAQNGTRVVDAAGLLSKTAEHDLDVKLKAFEDATTDQVIVVTVKSLGGLPIESYGYLLGREWGVGQSGQATAADGSVYKNNGIILLVAPKEREVRIEVGYGLEPVMTDALSSMIIRNVIIPEFKAGSYETGIVKGADAIIEELKIDRAAAVAAFNPGFAQPESTSSSGSLGALFVFLLIWAVPALGLWALFTAFGKLYRATPSGYVYQETQWDQQPYQRPRSSVSSFRSSRPSYRPSSPPSPPPPPPPPPPRSSGGGFRGGGGSFGGGGASGKW